MVGFCESGKECSGYIKFGEFLDYLRNYDILKEDGTPWSSLFTYILSNDFIVHRNVRLYCRPTSA
jgi:hypothetical protein